MRYNDIEKEIAELEKLVLKVPDEIVNLKTEGSLVGDFYKRKSVFITGASGFLGKILVEKLLRACTGIDTIYVMIREKKGKNLQTRLDEIYGNVVSNYTLYKRYRITNNFICELMSALLNFS